MQKPTCFSELPPLMQKRIMQDTQSRPVAPKLTDQGGKPTSSEQASTPREKLRCQRQKCNKEFEELAQNANVCCTCEKRYCWDCMSTCGKCASTECVDCMHLHDVWCGDMPTPVWEASEGATPKVARELEGIVITGHAKRLGQSEWRIRVDDGFVEVSSEFQAELKQVYAEASPAARSALRDLVSPKSSLLREQIRKVKKELDSEEKPAKGAISILSSPNPGREPAPKRAEAISGREGSSASAASTQQRPRRSASPPRDAVYR